MQGDFVSAVTAGSTFNFTAAYDQVYQQDECTKPRPVADQNPLESEDCLFLDVYVPEKVISKRRDGNGKSNPGAPVLVYFQDGAYVSGSKSDQNPSGLIATSREDGSTGIIYVGVNYRVRGSPSLSRANSSPFLSAAYPGMVSTSWAYLDGCQVRSFSRKGACPTPGCMMSVWR